jgi:cytochrome c6
MNVRDGRTLLATLALLVVAFLFAAQLRADDEAATLFKTKCAACHGPDGSGNTTMGKQMQSPDLRSEEVQKQTDAQLIEATTNGKGKKMPAYKDKLTSDQIKQLVAYIRELAKKK